MNDALERLKNRSRPVVPPRNTENINGEKAANPLEPSSPGTSTSRYLESNIQTQPKFEVPKGSEPKIKAGTSTPRYLESNIQTHSENENLETKASTFRLETRIAKALSAHCKDNEINRESLIEALFEYYQSHPEIQKPILTDAIARATKRQQLGNRRRAKTMIEKFGG